MADRRSEKVLSSANLPPDALKARGDLGGIGLHLGRLGGFGLVFRLLFL